MRARRLRPRLIASGSVIVLSLGSILAFAIASNGYPIRKLDLNDSGIWVTSDADGLFGRVNKSAGSLDAYFNPPGGAQASWSLDISQDAGMVVARDSGGGYLAPVDVALGIPLADQQVKVDPTALVDMRGGTLAVLEPKTGKVWAARYGGTEPLRLSALDSSSTPLLTLGAPQVVAGARSSRSAALAVGSDGAVHVASTSGKMATVAAAGAAFAKPVVETAPSPWQAIDVTALGAQRVVLDPAAGALSVAGGRTVSVDADPDARLQHPSGALDEVVLATAAGLVGIPLDDGPNTVLFAGAKGAPAAPLRAANCVLGAWAGTPGTVARGCDGAAVSQVPMDRPDMPLSKPVFRVNRGQVVLNDAATGRVFDIESAKSIDNWRDLKRDEKPQDTPKKPPKENPDADKNKKPKARDDDLGARPGRTTILHPLDNDSDTQGRILAVTSVGEVEGSPGASASVSPDGQSVRYTLPPDGGNASFTYTIDNGIQAASGRISVTAVAPGDNKAPYLRSSSVKKNWTIPSGGTVTVPVIGDWRDFDGDPVAVVDAGIDDKYGEVVPTFDGKLEFTAADTGAGQRNLRYSVSDGSEDEPVEQKVAVTVQGIDANSVKAVTEPDVARGEVGKPIVVAPLANDLPGSDPLEPKAKLALASELASKAGIDVETDLKSGQISVVASRAGAFFLDYQAEYGSAALAEGNIRIDVKKPPKQAEPPTAMPDTATVRGLNPVMIDVLANDFDPSGAVLTVTSVEAVDPDQVQVGIVRGRWLRIVPISDSFSPSPQLVRYVVSNGLAESSTGDVSVSQLPPVKADTPVARDDFAVVRDSDSVLIPALENDSTFGGAPLRLATNVDGETVGQLSVSETGQGEESTVDLGTAYVAGDSIRYVAPLKVATPRQVTIEYVVQAGLEQSVGTAYVTVNPQPGASNVNRAPTPAPVEARTTAGQTVTVTVPSSNADPDGDTVTVAGIASQAMLGRVIGVSPTSLTYEAYPTSVGTDSFSYVVTDRYGKSASSLVRVAVVRPGVAQVPMPIPDVMTVAPGARVTVDPMRNDLLVKGDPVTIVPLDQTNASVGGQATLDSEVGPLAAVAPTGDEPLSVSYALTSQGNDSGTAEIVIRAEEGYRNPPVVRDEVAKIEGTKATVNVLAGAYDPDGDTAALTVRSLDARGTIAGEQLSATVGPTAQVIPFEMTDETGATSVAVVYVPAAGSGAPIVKAGAEIKVDQNKSVTVNVADYVISPAGKPVSLTTRDRIWASPAGALTVSADKGGKLTVTGVDDYIGPGALTLEVTDGATLTDPAGKTAIVTIPVQVGPVTPFIRCPEEAERFAAGSKPRQLDITTLCHVWLPRGEGLGELTYSATFTKPVPGVSVSGPGRVLTVTVAGAAEPNTSAELAISVVGSAAKASTLRLKIVAAPKPRITPITLEGIKQGTTAEIDVKSYMRSPYVDEQFTVVSVTKVSGAAATTSPPAGSKLTITPGASSSGRIVYSLVASDLADTARADRHVKTTITLDVYGVPDPPSAPRAGRTVESRSATLSWKSGSPNGARIDYFEVVGAGKTQRCPGSPCKITGLENGVYVTFTVRAHNKAGFSAPSATSERIRPDAVPKAVRGFTASDPADKSLRLTWQPAVVDGTPVKTYKITWAGGSASVSGSSTSTVVRGLDNHRVTKFSIVAVNEEGPSASAKTTGQSSGRPAAPRVNEPSLTSNLTAARAAVRVTWDAVSPNGPGRTTYVVTRSGPGGEKQVCSAQTTRVCNDDLDYDGQVYTYSVVAANDTGGAAHTSPPGRAAFTPIGQPDVPTDFTVAAQEPNGQLYFKFSVGESRGSESFAIVSGGSGGDIRIAISADSTYQQSRDMGPIGTPRTLSVRLCNEARCSSDVSGPRATPYGPLGQPSISANASGTSVSYSARVDANGKAATVRITSSRGYSRTETITGSSTLTGSDSVGYSTSVTYTVTISDDGRGSKSDSASDRTADPPPPPKLTAFKGGPFNPKGCDSSACRRVGTTTENFPGTVSCRIVATSIGSISGFLPWTQGGNDTQGSPNAYGYPGGWVDVECDGVRDRVDW